MPGLHCSFSFFKQVTYFQLHLYSHLQRFLVLPVPKIWENLRHTLVCSLLAPPHSTWVSARAALEISRYSSILFSPSRMLLSSLSCCCLLCSYWLHDFMSFYSFTVIVVMFGGGIAINACIQSPRIHCKFATGVVTVTL